MHQFVPDVVNPYPDYLVGIENGHLVRVPAGVQGDGKVNLKTVSPLIGTQSVPGGSITFTFGVIMTNTGSVNLSPTSTGTVTISPSGTGTVAIQPASGDVTVGPLATGVTTLNRVGKLGFTYTDHGTTASGLTTTTKRGRVRIPAGGSTFTVNLTGLTAAAMVVIQQREMDATLLYARAVAGAGSFTITGNAAATADTYFDYCVIE